MAKITRSGTDPAEGPEGGGSKRTHVLGLVNGTLVQAGNRLMDPALVLAAFVTSQTGSRLLVGLLATLSWAGYRWPQLYVSSLIEHRERKKLFYVVASVMRVLMLATMIAAVWLTVGGVRWWAMALFFVAYFAFRTGQGCASLPFLDILAGSIGSGRVGGFFAQRHFLGRGAALLFVFPFIQVIEEHVAEPNRYALFIAAALVVMAAAWAAFSLVREQENPRPPRRRTFVQTIAAGVQMLKQEPNYRGLLRLRILAHVNILALVFYVPYGVERLGVAGISGIFIGFMSASELASSLIWGKISNTKGNRLVLVLAAGFFVLSPLTALVAPRLPDVFHWAIPWTSVVLDLPLLVYLLALSFFGFARLGNMVGSMGFVIESAPPERRPSYIAFLNTVTFPMTLTPLVAGALVGQAEFGVDVLFAVAVLSGVLTLISSIRLTEVRRVGPAAPD